jgi:hypothetical protein
MEFVIQMQAFIRWMHYRCHSYFSSPAPVNQRTRDGCDGMLMLQVTTRQTALRTAQLTTVLDDQVDGYKVETTVSLDPSDLNLIAEMQNERSLPQFTKHS